jgi:DNA-binding NarL/FixJ family response regulator
MSYLILAEDDDMILSMYTMALKKLLTVEVVGAENGEEALKIISLKEELPQMVITDLEMPVMDGRELISALREKYPEISVVALSGDEEIMELEGVTEVWLKPLTPTELCEKIKSLL